MGSVYVTKAAFPVVKEKGYGRIVLTTSVSGLFGNFGQTNYSAAKLGIVGIMNSLKLEALNEVKCAALATRVGEGTSQSLPVEREVQEELIAELPGKVNVTLGAGVNPKEVARLIVFLGSGAAI